ncbi:MAG: hypothetical protein MUF01_06420 [Bryobacterales bacterium]|jgi:hypothetical protein|nr:hypothetical protein [Bryobacterales bacterium]
MGYVLQRAIQSVVSLLTGPGGIGVQLEQLADDQPAVAHAIAGFVVRGYPVKRGVVPDEDFTCDPRIRIQVEKLVNSQRVKFIPFSGHCSILLTVEAADDRQELVAEQLNAICDAILLVLDNHVGQLAPGICYGGGYELSVAPMDRGGHGYQQVAQLRFQLAMEEGGTRAS